jgi:hypothetical protein
MKGIHDDRMEESAMKVEVNGLLPVLLGVLFIGLKLTGHIDWSWLWVLSPFWLPIVIVGTIWLIVVLPLIALARQRDWRRR